MSTRIVAQIRAMAEADVLRFVPSRIIKDIKRDDPHPLFKAFVIGGEGEWRPTIVGIGQTIQRWFRGAVQALGNKLNIGTSVFNGHAKTNDHDGRVPVGEVIGKTFEKIKDGLSAIAVAYIYPEFKDIPFDVASIEADLAVPVDARAFEVDEPDVLDVTGIALGNSQTDKPAFPGATLQAALQAFAETKPRKETNAMALSLDDIKAAIQEGKFKPSDVFAPKEITSDPFISEQIEEKINNAKGYQIRRAQTAEEKATALEKENSELKSKVNTFSMETLRSKGRDTLANVLKERKLDGDEKFKKFVNKAFDRDFKSTDESALKKDLDKLVDVQLDEFKDLVGTPAAVGGGTEHGGPGAGANEGTPGVSTDDLVDPKKNDFIPQ